MNDAQQPAAHNDPIQTSSQQDVRDLQTPAPPIPDSNQQGPISGISKESGPIVSSETNQVMELSEPEPQLSPEVQEAGVEIVPQTPLITPQQQAVGVQPAPAITPVPAQPTDGIIFPMTATQAQQVIQKDKHLDDAVVWLAMLIIREIHMMEMRKQNQKLDIK